MALSYIGQSITSPPDRQGTIGRAKEHIEDTVGELNRRFTHRGDLWAVASVNKALVTRASAVIPAVPL